MATNLSLRSLLDSDKLRGSNFDSSYQKLKIVLEHERILYILTDLAPEESAPNVHGAIRDTCLKWLNVRTTIHYIMLVAMNDEFSHRFENAQPQNMLQMLNESFGMPDDIERHKMSCTIFNAKMRKGASVIDHVLYMIELIECLSKLGFSLYEQLEKDVILNSLPKFYLLFLTHYRMTKPAVNYHSLLRLL